MIRFGNFIKGFFLKRKRNETTDVEQLRTAFRERYHQFKLLLNANNEALAIMAEIEEALRGAKPFGMTFVRSHCTRVATNVFQIIKLLKTLAPERYELLYKQFKEIQLKINTFIIQKHPLRKGALVLRLQDVDKDFTDLVGSKIASLGEITKHLNINVPKGFVVTADGYYHFIEHNDLQSEINRLVQTTNIERFDQLYAMSSSIQRLIIGASIPESLKKTVMEHCWRLEEEEGKEITLALRSSALGEDFANTSFAGQYRSALNVSPENIFYAYKEIVASKYGLQAMTYRLNRGIRDEGIAMCVGCMRMVDALSGGVIYSRNPVDIRDNSIVINSVWGLPKSVVDGSINPDYFILARDDPPVIQGKEIPLKEQKFVCYPSEGVCRLDLVGEESREASLQDDQAVSLARISLQLDAYYGRPVDMEWAIDKEGNIIILQCRPLQQREISESGHRKANSEPLILEGGVTASPGAASGPVFIVKKEMDTLRFPQGAILLTEQALPRWSTILNRAAAVITAQGSVAGHLASVAREFRIPALFGVKDAMSSFKDEQVITLDAAGRRIYAGRIESFLINEKGPKNLMEGSPVFEILKGVSQHIIPLNLLDPDAPDFRPESCRTFHDITRFCHEKSVHEMFRFGKDHKFPERSSKQLVAEVPMQWWVLNLDDGFQEEVEGKYVQLENIASIPMLALWDGITRVSWEGPPPVDGKGLMSVMFHATRNPALVTGIPSRYANRNYFMISKNYCSLNSRLGFHFSTVEALVSDRSSENYISFQFKGGAADSQRRHKRILFVSEILDENGFRLEIREDHLIARLENYEKDHMENSLKILGYLTIHTRQLDMIMSNNASFNYYRTKIKEDIQGITQSK
jgi:pyruvate,water dikinase